MKRDDQPKRGQMLVGFLHSAEDEPRHAGAAFQDLDAGDVLSLEQFAQICDAMR